jgi:CDP-diacylglycerol--glycerol-3-phosphate 3-phosphatidyltransferase
MVLAENWPKPYTMRCILRADEGLSRTLKLNLANILTLFRIAAIPVVVICFYSALPNARPIAAVIFGIAAVTDFIDGWVARRFNQTSRFGEFLDPVADKLMVAIVLVMLVQAESTLFEDVIAMIIIGREITISALREWMATIGERAHVKVGWAGKVKTTLQMFGIAFMVYKNPLLGVDMYTVGFGLLVVAAIMTIFSMITYLKAAWPFISVDQG